MTDLLAPPAPGDNQVHADFIAGRTQAAQPPDAFAAAVAAAGQAVAKTDALPPAAPAQAGGIAPALAPVGGQPSPATGYPVVAPHPAPDGSGQTTNLSDADYFSFTHGNPGRAVLDRLLSSAALMSKGEAAVTANPAAVATDMAGGLLDAPRQILGGVLDYGNNLMKFADTVVQHAEAAGLPNVYVKLFDTDGTWDPSIQTTEQFRAAQAAGTDGVFQLPTTGGAQTVTGDLIRAATTFLAARQPMVAGAGGAPGLATSLLASAGAGATGVDPNAPRLSNLIDQVAPNFLTEWLKAKPEDQDGLLARLKSALDYAGMDAAFSAIVPLLKGGLAAAKTLGKTGEEITPPAPQAAAPAASAAEGTAASPGVAATASAGNVEAPAGASDAKPILPLGDAAAPLVQISPAVAGQADDFHFMIAGTHRVKINLGRVGSGQDIADALEDVSRFIPAQGVQTNDATAALADALGLAPGDLLRGYAGSQLDAVQTTAMRTILDSSAAQLVDFAKAATDPATNTQEAKAMMVRAFATHRALQQYAENARAEAGRTLQSWAMMSHSSSDQAKAIKDIIEAANGGTMDIESLAEKLAVLDPAQAGRYVGQVARNRRLGMTIFYNALLSNPRTVVKKLASDGGMGLWNLATRYAAEQRGSGAVPAGETAQLAAGYVGAMRDGFRMAGRALVAGRSQFHPEAATLTDALGPRANVLAAGAPAALDAADPAAAAVQYWRAAFPTSWIGAADDFAKFVNYRAELRSLAFRDGVQNGLGDTDLATHISTTMDAPPQDMQAQAWSAAQRTTFQTPLTGFPKDLETMVDAMNVPLGSSGFTLPVGRILMPFVKVPANIVAWSYRNTALAKMFPTEAIKAELAAGGATRDLAIARMSLGSALALAMSDLALTHSISGKGPTDPQLQRAWRAAGNEPYSIRVGGKWYGYSQVEPLGMLTSSIADTYDIARFAKDEDREQLALSLILGTGNALLSRTYASGIGQFFEALNNPETEGQNWAEQLVASMVTPPGVAATAQAIDPWVRAHQDMIDAIEKRVPYLSENLPPARSLWGDPIPAREGWLPPVSGSAAADVLSPVTVAPAGGEPIDKWIWDNRQAFPSADDNRLGISKASRFQNFAGGQGASTQLELTPAEHDRLQVLAGNDLKDQATGLGAKDYLNALLAGKNPDTAAQAQWNLAAPAMRAVMVQRTINRFREAARRKLLTEYPDVADAVQAGLGARKQQLTAPAAPAMPQIGGP